ncbi:hypothetical protein HMP0721_1079 [Pseudoramibacter alactolyticus ATCC 23263]|uniref:Uncharacterized protein n=1 Tax=Pseudoramibacter alactolyticus ATCC 23263 TaxID=887929 RepID=E6MGE6_9FIRM|nr:hypothetical protein HMP0721_1079 [Pseudoramibacter alactolyticus ATCC 23263]
MNFESCKVTNKNIIIIRFVFFNAVRCYFQPKNGIFEYRFSLLLLTKNMQR